MLFRLVCLNRPRFDSSKLQPTLNPAMIIIAHVSGYGGIGVYTGN